MKKFLLKLLIFVAVVFVLDKAFLGVRYLAPKYDYDHRIQHVLDGKINKDLLIFGSSRGTADIVTWMFEDSLGISAFNLSYGGGEIELENFILTQVIDHHETPKYVIKLVDDDFELYYHNENAYRADRLYRLVEYPEVREELIRKDEINPFLSKIFILSQLKKPVYNFQKTKPLNDTILKYGNLPSRGHRPNQDWNVENINTYKVDDEIDSKKKAFTNFQELCLKNNVTLILTIPPSFQELNPAFEKRMKELVLPGVHFYTYDTANKAYSDTTYFQDRFHQNLLGASLYTGELVQYLKSIRKKDAN